MAASLLLAYQAGCIGDVKGGALGDPHAALQTESRGVGFGWLAVLIFSALAGIRPKFSGGQRAAAVVATLVFGFIAFTIAGIQLEIWGVQSCFS